MTQPVTARTYAEAVDELEVILTELEDDHIDVDVLATRVKEAAELLRFCRQRIDTARVEIEKVMTELGDGTDVQALQ